MKTSSSGKGTINWVIYGLSVALGFFVLLSGVIGEFVFVVVVIATLWQLSERVGALQRRVTELEPKQSMEATQAPPPPA